ncbi:MAG: major capsid protein [Athalassotoga sp.]
MGFSWVFLTRLYKITPSVPKFLTAQLSTQNVDYSPIAKVRVVSQTNSITLSRLGRRGDTRQAVKVSDGLSEMYLDPAQIWEHEDMTEDDVLGQNANPSLLAISGVSDVISSKEYARARKMTILKQRISARLEKMYADLISTGQITYSDGGNVFTSAFVTPSNYTLSSSTKIVSDLEDIVLNMKASGFIPSFIIVSPSVARALWDNTQFNKAVDKMTFNLAQMNQSTSNIAYGQLLASIVNLPPIYVYDAQYVDDNGTVQHFFDNKMIVVSKDAVGTGYGAFVNFNVDASGNPIMGDVFAWEDKPEDGHALYLNVASRPLPYIVNAHGVKIYNVTVS